MLSIIKESFKITNNSLFLATPLILFSFLASLYLLFSMSGNILNLIITAILFFLMLAAFLSGWLYLTTRCVKQDSIEDPNKLILEFPSGVGEFFLPVIGMLINIFIIALLFLIASNFIGMKLIGDTGINFKEFYYALSSTETIKTFLNSLSAEQIIKLNKWNLLIFGTMLLNSLALMFYSPALFFKSKNPFKAFIFSIKDLLSKKFIMNISLFIFIFVTYIVMSILTTLAGINIVAHFLFTLINFYYTVFITVLVYNYYYSNFIKKGSNIDMTL